MPTYEYECTSCGQHIEVFQRFTEEALTTCAACGGRLRKVFHPAGIVFKGSGFYATDSRSSAKAGTKKESETTPASTTSEGSASPSDGSSSKASGSKAATKPASKDKGS
jgi:putative FmdB family regulatory protein